MKYYLFFFLFQFGIIQAQENTIKGKVTDNTDNSSLSGALISIKEINKTTAVLSDGTFKIEHLLNGSYHLKVSMVGYETIDLNFKLPEMKDSVLSLQLKPSIKDMEEIVVTGTRSERKIKDVPVLTQVIHSEKLIKEGITNVSTALERELPGLDFSTAQNSLRPTVSFQGMNANYILVLIDGERIAGAMNGSVDLSRYNLENVDRIEIVRGASSILYGSSAMGGVINIITKRPANPLDFNINARYTKYNELSVSSMIATKIRSFASSTDFAYNQSYGYDLNPKQYETTAWTQEPYNSGIFNQKFDYYFSKKLSISTNGSLYLNRLSTAKSSSRIADSAYMGLSGGVKALYKISDLTNLSLSYAVDKYSNYVIWVNENDKTQKTADDILQSAKLLANIGFGKGLVTVGAE